MSSLRSLCIKAIVKNFDHFYSYDESENSLKLDFYLKQLISTYDLRLLDKLCDESLLAEIIHRLAKRFRRQSTRYQRKSASGINAAKILMRWPSAMALIKKEGFDINTKIKLTQFDEFPGTKCTFALSSDHNWEVLIEFSEGGECENDPLHDSIKMIDVRKSMRRTTDVGAGIIARILWKFDNIRVLYLTSCSIGNIGSILLAAAVKSSCNLKILDLSNEFTTTKEYRNFIGDKGVQAICHALTFNNSLEKLVLDYNPIYLSGGLSLAQLITTNTIVSAISIKGTFVRDAAEQLARAFLQSDSLNVLNVDWCSFPEPLGYKVNQTNRKRNRERNENKKDFNILQLNQEKLLTLY